MPNHANADLNADPAALPNIVAPHFHTIAPDRLAVRPGPTPPRILILYGSTRDKSYSRLLAFEAERLLRTFGAETSIYDPRGSPCRTTRRPIIPRSVRCATCALGPKAWCGCPPSGTAP